MGYIVSFKCNKCDTDTTFHLGSGRKELGIERVVGYCDSCKEYGLYKISYEIGQNGELIESMENCSCGGKTTVVLNGSIYESCEGKIPCRKCGGEIAVERTGHFD